MICNNFLLLHVCAIKLLKNNIYRKRIYKDRHFGGNENRTSIVIGKNIMRKSGNRFFFLVETGKDRHALILFSLFLIIMILLLLVVLYCTYDSTKGGKFDIRIGIYIINGYKTINSITMTM